MQHSYHSFIKAIEKLHMQGVQIFRTHEAFLGNLLKDEFYLIKR